jgi:hypothetical protein
MIPDTTSLTIGPLRATIAAPDPAVHLALRSAYGAFAVGASPAPHALIARVDYTPGPAPADWPFAFERGVLRFTAAHCTGSLDLIARRAHLRVIAPHPFEPIDYFVRAALALLAFEAGGLLFHAAGLARRGNGYAFFGYSGSGKTTVARVSSDVQILNDDLVILLPDTARWNIYATPFCNPTQVTPAGPQFAPLAALYRLMQDRQVFVEPIAPAAAMAELIACSPVVSADPDRALALLALAEHLASAVPVRRLHFLPDASFWAVIST